MAIAKTLQEIHDNVPKVYEAGRTNGYDSGYSEGHNTGYSSGHETGYSKGYEAGTKNGLPSEWDSFWDAFQMSGERTNYDYAFKKGWTADTFKPKYDIKPEGQCRMLFNGCLFEGDLVQHLEECGVTLNTGKCTNLLQAFASAKITRVGEIDVTGLTVPKGTTYMFATWIPSCLKTIDKLIINENTEFYFTFYQQSALENLTIDGTIAQNGFSVEQATKLTKESITSIINALSTTTSGLTVTLSKTAVNNAFGIDVDDLTTWGEGTEYYTLRHSKDNWSISYM